MTLTLKLEICGSIDPNQAFDISEVRQALKARVQSLSHNTALSGRPGTRVRISGGNVAKTRTCGLDPETARKYVKRILETERRLRAHPPEKTWFVRNSGASVEIGNLTPYLDPIGSWFDKSGTGFDLTPLERAWQLYFRVAADYGLRLDEGLTNFGMDENGVVYYLDDDLYEWDEFSACAHSLGVLIRKFDGIPASVWKRAGAALRSLLAEYFGYENSSSALGKEIRDVPLTATEQRTARRALLETLEGDRAETSACDIRPRNRRLAVLADVHGNWPALNSVLKELEQLGICDGFVLGDIVGYGPHPKQCIDAIRDMGFGVIKGNHDAAAGSDIELGGFSPDAWRVIEWTREILDAKDRAWLRSQPPYARDGDWLAVHGSPVDRYYYYGYVYDMTFEKNLQYMQECGLHVCFHGHSHLRGIYYDRAGIRTSSLDVLQDLGSYRHALVCPGSVGQPRDGCPEAQFAVLYADQRTIEFRKCGYAIEQTVADIRRHGLPEGFAKRLPRGV